MSIKLKSINTKILAGTLVFTLFSAPLVGCNGSELKYEKDSSGNAVCVQNIKYYYLKEYKVLVLGKGEELFFYIVKSNSVEDQDNQESYVGYYDVFGGNLISSDHEENGFKIVTLYELNAYLISYNLIKEQYSEHDLKKLLEGIENDFYKKTARQKIK